MGGCYNEEIKLLFKEFEDRSKEIHGDKYKYNSNQFFGYKKHTEIFCEKHGYFRQTPAVHLSGSGCKACHFDVRKLSAEEFFQFALAIHKGKYSYFKSKFVDRFTEIEITCDLHGTFWQTPKGHLIGRGCKLCKRVSITKSKTSNLSIFVEKARKVHGDAFDYSYSEYVSAKTKLKIKCRQCTQFFYKTPDKHLSGQGCTYCSTSGLKMTLPTYLYVIKFDNITKVGISNNASSNRLNNIRNNSKLDFREIVRYQFDNGATAYEVEQKILAWMKCRYKNTTLDFSGKTESFEEVIIDSLIYKINEIIAEVNLDT